MENKVIIMITPQCIQSKFMQMYEQYNNSRPRCFVDNDPCGHYDGLLCNEHGCDVYTREAYLGSLGLVGKFIGWFEKKKSC